MSSPDPRSPLIQAYPVVRQNYLPRAEQTTFVIARRGAPLLGGSSGAERVSLAALRQRDYQRLGVPALGA